jgi:transposase
MAAPEQFTVLQGHDELLELYKSCPEKFAPRIRMLLAIINGTTSINQLAVETGVSRDSIRAWRKIYNLQGIDGLIKEQRGGPRANVLNKTEQLKLRIKMRTAGKGFNSFSHATLWINLNFGLSMSYDAVRMYLRRNFGNNCIIKRRPTARSESFSDLVQKRQENLRMTDGEVFQKLKIYPLHEVDYPKRWPTGFQNRLIDFLGFDPFPQDDFVSKKLTFIFTHHPELYRQLPKITGFDSGTIELWREKHLVPSRYSLDRLLEYLE